MSNIFFHGVWRMDWGFGNPNKTAAFIAILMIAIWILAYARKWGFWVALVGFVGLGISLVHTMSRGGLIALAVGLVPLILWAPRPWKGAKLVAVLVGVWSIVGASIYLKAHERYLQGTVTEDRSISNRLEIWKAAPAMMVNAPGGWGLGNSGNAYVQWYQSLDKSETYRTLVNSHLTWMVELGWPLRILYVCGWGLIFLICWPSSQSRSRSVALGAWLCFFAAAIFSSVAEAPAMWAIPLLLLLAAIVSRLVRKEFPSPIQWTIPIVATVAITCAIWLLGNRTSALQKIHHLVAYGNGAQKTLVVYDSATMGNLYGRSIRAACKSPLALFFTGDVLPPVRDETLVLGGALPAVALPSLKAAIHDCQKLVLLNPKFFPQEIGVDDTYKSKVTTYFGDFSQSPSMDAWQAVSTSQQLSGIGDFVPNWPSLLSGNSLQYGKR
jgi:hypothetical protein